MNIVIVGGGKLGYYLAINLLDHDCRVRLIEKDKTKCFDIANKLDVEVIHGNGTEIDTLIKADIERADCFIAVTGRDQDNLVACQIAKQKFNVSKVIARANNPKNLKTIRALGVDIAVSSTEIITRLIEQEVQIVGGMHLLASLNKGKAAICTVIIAEDSYLNGVQIKDVKLPESSLIISLLRNETLIIPKGDTYINSGDEIVAVCDGKSQKQLMKVLV